MGADLIHESNENLLSFGQYGLRILTSTSAAGEYFCALYALEGSQVDFTNNSINSEGDTTVSNLSIPSGGMIYGKFSDITVDSGTVVGYLMEV